MVYEVTNNYAYIIGLDLGRDKASTIKGFQKSKVRIAVQHWAKRDQTSTNRFCVGFWSTLWGCDGYIEFPNSISKTSRMVYFHTSTTHLNSPDSIEGHVAARGTRDCNENRGISSRRWWRDGTSSNAVGITDNYFFRAYQRKGEMRKNLVYQM